MTYDETIKVLVYLQNQFAQMQTPPDDLCEAIRIVKAEVKRREAAMPRCTRDIPMRKYLNKTEAHRAALHRKYEEYQELDMCERNIKDIDKALQDCDRFTNNSAIDGLLKVLTPTSGLVYEKRVRKVFGLWEKVKFYRKIMPVYDDTYELFATRCASFLLELRELYDDRIRKILS